MTQQASHPEGHPLVPSETLGVDRDHAAERLQQRPAPERAKLIGGTLLALSGGSGLYVANEIVYDIAYGGLEANFFATGSVAGTAVAGLYTAYRGIRYIGDYIDSRTP